jgi:cellobiose transport system permease protein
VTTLEVRPEVVEPKAAATRSRKRRPSAIARQDRIGFLYVAPFFVHFVLFGALPIVFTTGLAFFNVDWSTYYDFLDRHNFQALKDAWVGMRNFDELWSDPYFWLALKNTFSIWAISTIPQLIMAFGLAMLLANPKLRGSSFWRTLLMVPNITSVLAVAIVFQQIFGRDFGLINVGLHYVNVGPIEWINERLPSHVAIATMINWRWLGYNSLILLSAILAIPRELYESAAIDGASRVKTVWYVTIPQLRNTITFMLIMGTIGGLGLFVEPLTYGGGLDGGANSQFLTLTLYLFKELNQNERLGYAAAIGVGITIVVIIISALNFLITRRIASEDSR